MATASSSSSLCSSEEKTNGFKLMRLIIDGGTGALRNLFQSKLTGDLLTVLGFYRPTLQSLKTKKNITPPQWEILYPPVPMTPNIKEFDITLLVLLLRNICGISAPIGTGWNNMPMDKDHSQEANIVRIKLFRNKFFGHISDTSVSTTEFEARWKEVSITLVHLGISQVEIDRLKHEECGQEEVDRIRKEWSENDTKVGLQLLGLKKMRKKERKLLLGIQSDVKSLTQDKQRSHNILNKHLNCCDFGTDIELLYQKWCKDTREWVFDQVSKWFNDTTSENRAFIITAQPGMGKSVIAAVICKRYAKQLAAFHFCQYNNDRYNDPKTLLQSLARQLSNVLREYKKALIEKLSGKEGRRLDDMNIQGLFSMLFKEPLTGIDVAEKRYLIVIDAVDESEREGKNDLVELIADYLDQLPSFIRILITTRPENHISKKFEKLNPMFLSPNDEQNVKDIKRLFEEKLSKERAKYIGSLLEKSEGLMLFANYLLEVMDDCSLNLDIDDIPTGIQGIYTSYFKRWEKEFQIAEVQQNDFLSFLSVLTVSKEPLPETLVARVFDSENSSHAIAKRKMHKIKNCLSLLLVFQQDRLSFFHKSVKDWLLECNHEFTVDEKFGHETLANICAREMDELKKKMIEPPFHSAAEYALLYGIQHKLAGNKAEPMNSFIDRYVTDLEIMYASISVDVFMTFKNIKSLKEDICNSVPEASRRTFETLMLLIRKYSYILKDFPRSFLQHVRNIGGEELSFKAASLLNYRYKDLIYLERMDKGSSEDSLLGRIHTSGNIVGIDISPSEDYVVCSYTHGEIELFSVEDMKSLWTIKNVEAMYVERRNIYWIFRSIVFHPLKNVILPSRLDSVINLKGRIEPGPFSCKDINPLFQNCCFSNDKSKMATIYRNNLTVWNLANNAKLKSFSSNTEFLSVSFSANGRFLATSQEGNQVVVYDFEREDDIISRVFHDQIHFISTFESDSWYCSYGPFFLELKIVRPDLLALDPVPYVSYARPLNVRAVAEFEDFFNILHFLEDKPPKKVKPWFASSLSSHSFFCLDHDIALFTKRNSRELNFYRISKLKESLLVKFDHDHSQEQLFSVHISVDGKFIYRLKYKELWLDKLDSNYSIVMSSNVKWSFLQFVPVTNGVFSMGKLHDSVNRFNDCWFENDIPELWNSDLTQLLDSFPECSGTRRCLSVSDDIVACIMAGQVCFFNVVERKIVSKTTRVPQDFIVKACSSKYHVLFGDCFSLWQDGEVVGEWANVNSIVAGAVQRSDFFLEEAIFSPSSAKLALRIWGDHSVYIFDVVLARLRRKVDFEFLHSGINYTLLFLDEDHLLCSAYDTAVCVFNGSSGNAITCVNIGDHSADLRVTRKPANGCVLLCAERNDRKIKLFKVWLPR